MGTTSHRIPSFVLSARLRLLCLRLIVFMSLIEAGIRLPDIHDAPHWMSIVHLVIIMVIVVHHTGIAFGPRLFPLLVWADIGLMVAETSGHAGLSISAYGRVVLPLDGERFSRYPSVALVAVADGGLALSLLVLLILKILAILNAWGMSPMRRRVDIALGGPLSPWWRYPANAIFGIKLWERRIP
ncbi:hypothetical protein FA13DRAFT_1735701 [Coprinellus micaceus]|uniref:Uncharacterized protein n=1 Tax=Coprinellus micaceus TaxID=71717 RepID=A0A4Y7T2D8_COPMI|nr:hypothetical protein FA13DRAFT_1735701 [Coprinellus micaceus]